MARRVRTGGTEATLRVTVAALMHVTGERQRDLAAVLGIEQSEVSRRQTGRAAWTLDNIDVLSQHWAIPVPDLMCGPTRAVDMLPPERRADVMGGSQQAIPLAG